MRVKEITVSVGQVVAARSQFEPDKITLTATVIATTDDERDIARLGHHCRELTETLTKAARKLTGVALFTKSSKE